MKLLILLGQSREGKEEAVVMIKNIYVSPVLWVHVLSCILPSQPKRLLPLALFYLRTLLPTPEVTDLSNLWLSIVGTTHKPALVRINWLSKD